MNQKNSFQFNEFQFPKTIIPTGRYLFYLPGKIVEDQDVGTPIHPVLGAYQYFEILNFFKNQGYSVISSRREKNSNIEQFAQELSYLIQRLLSAGVPAQNISVVGASKGAIIGAIASTLIDEDEIRYVLLAFAHKDFWTKFSQKKQSLKGRVLAIYENTDPDFGTAQSFAETSEEIFRFNEIRLNTNLGHGFIYKPIEDWTLPTLEWLEAS